MIKNKEKLDGCTEELKTALDSLSIYMGFDPITISSGFCSGDPLAHGRGEAVDICCIDSDYGFNTLLGYKLRH